MDEQLSDLLSSLSGSTANLQLPNPGLRDYYRDEKERNFYVCGNINYDVEGEYTTDLMELNKMIIRCNMEDKGKPSSERLPVKVWIDSYGGDIVSVWSAIQLIEISKTPVYTICLKQAYSAAADLLAAGHKRYTLPGTTGMVHLGSCGYGGDQTTVEVTKKYFDKLGKSLIDYFLSKTKIDAKTFKKKTVTDWYMTDYEMLENGLVDKVIADLDEIF